MRKNPAPYTYAYIISYNVVTFYIIVLCHIVLNCIFIQYTIRQIRLDLLQQRVLQYINSNQSKLHIIL